MSETTPTTRFEFAPFSDAAREALQVYTDVSGGHSETNELHRGERTVKLLESFAPDSFPETAFDAAALQSIARFIYLGKPVRRHAAAKSFHSYFTSKNRDNRRKHTNYVGTLTGDGKYINAAANSYQSRLREHDMESVLDGDQPLESDTFLSLRVGPNIPEIAQVNRITNIESILGASALAIDRINHPRDDDRYILGRILEMESFYAPLLDTYGLHAFGMIGTSSAGKKRVLMSGNEQVLESSFATMERAKQIGTDEILFEIFGKRPNEHVFHINDGAEYGEDVVFSTTSLGEIYDEYGDMELNSRFKAVGSYALKLLRNPNYQYDNEAYQPMDVFGLTAIVPDNQALAGIFSKIVTHVANNPNVEFRAAASKTKPLYIQGSKEYVEDIMRQIPAELKRYVEPKVHPKDPCDVYQVAKFTCAIDFNGYTLPVEMQFQTEFDRDNARFGVPSHLNHHSAGGLASVIPGDKDDLRLIYTRKTKIDQLGEIVNGQSIPHGLEFRDEYMRALDSV